MHPGPILVKTLQKRNTSHVGRLRIYPAMSEPVMNIPCVQSMLLPRSPPRAKEHWARSVERRDNYRDPGRRVNSRKLAGGVIGGVVGGDLIVPQCRPCICV